MVQRLVVFLCCLFAVLPASAQSINGEAEYVSFSVPGAQGTYPMSMNDSMMVTGYYNDSATTARGFIREADGTLTTFAIDGAIWTQPESINSAGDVTGFYEMTTGAPQAFVRLADGRVTYNPTGTPLLTIPISINDFGDVGGSIAYKLRMPGVFLESHGEFQILRGPESGDTFKTLATSMNWSGAIVGYNFAYAADTYTGFLSHPDGYWKEFTVPLAGQECTTAGAVAKMTIPEALNTSGVIAGYYEYTNQCATELRGSNVLGVFILQPDGKFTLFSPPGTLQTQPVFEFTPNDLAVSAPHWISLNDYGDLAGSYIDLAGAQHGFVRNPYGTMTTFDPPEGGLTASTTINDLGQIAGYYTYKTCSCAPVGFIRIPVS